MIKERERESERKRQRAAFGVELPLATLNDMIWIWNLYV